MFKSVSPRVDFVNLEKDVLKRWEKLGILEKYLSKNKESKKRFSFLDGPITANNPMGVHHAWGRTYKDLWQRFFNMFGLKQRFQNGFDNQGLWVEVEVEKELGFKNKKDIEKYGIEEFVNKCKERTLHFAKVQTKQSQRLGYFMDWKNSYYTMSEDNNYMIWSFLKKAWEVKGKKGIYKGRDAVPWCPRCGTAISQHEILTEEYKELTHDSVYLRLPLKDKKDEYFLVWTTTPWTIPANVLLAVNPKLKYSLVSFENNKYWLASSLVKNVFKEGFKVEKEVLGKELEGISYQGPFDNLPIVKKIAKDSHFHTIVLSRDLVNEEEGTGLVHIAPGCGSEDFQLVVKEYKWPELVLPAIGEEANYIEGYGNLTGKNAKDKPDLIIDYLKEKDDFLFRVFPYNHRYPTCWRCKEELVWRVVDEWYIAMDPFRENIKNVAKKINWIPKWGLKMELDWLKNMGDWLISKKRYWGLVLPIWECQKCGNFEVIGSKEELKEKAIQGWKEFEGHTPHRPWIDKVKIKCSKCGSVSSRIKDVGNPWLDAGIVPFSTLNYRKDKKYWQEWFPADFITECYLGQFRNWFYSLLAMSTVLEDKPPFKNLLGHASVKDEKGEEMHKSKGNAIAFDEAADKIGVDVMRWMYCRQNPEISLNFGYKAADDVRRKFHLLLWNVYNFFINYANLDKWQPKKNTKTSKNVLDKWILSRINGVNEDVIEDLNKFDAFTATKRIEAFLNDLSLWYLRRSRSRVGFKAISSDDKNDCYNTFYQVLVDLSKIISPFIPFLSEEIYTNLTSQDSVHLCDWPKLNKDFINKDLEKQMKFVREVCEMGHSLRKEENIKVRQPLQSLTIEGRVEKLSKGLIQLIKEELNIKEIKLNEKKKEIKAILDTKITPELKAEGEARELIRQIQQLRKETGCSIDQKIKVAGPNWPKQKNLLDYIKKETLSEKLLPSDKLKIVS